MQETDWISSAVMSARTNQTSRLSHTMYGRRASLERFSTMVLVASVSNESMVSVNDLASSKMKECGEISRSERFRHRSMHSSDAKTQSERFDRDFLPLVQQPLHYQSQLREPIDRYMSSFPAVVEGAQELLLGRCRLFTRDSSERVLYVGQGEVAHAVPSQCDVVMSDKATTCHIIAVRSLCETPLTSLAHVDGPGYEQCVRKMIRFHREYAYQTYHGEEKKSEDEDGRVTVEVHIVGGYDDSEGSSREISTFIIDVLARMAYDERHTMKIMLKTCAISSLNDDGTGRPVGRGLGISCSSGGVFLAKATKDVEGPATELRSARLWSGKGGSELTVIHSPYSEYLFVKPFELERPKHSRLLLSMLDTDLLQCTSTSPEVEEEGFCNEIRRTLRFMLKASSAAIFGEHVNRSVKFHRVGVNKWYSSPR